MSASCSAPTFQELLGIALVHMTWQLACLTCIVALLSHSFRLRKTVSRSCLLVLFLGPVLLLGTLVCLSNHWLPLEPRLLATRLLGISIALWLTRLWIFGLSIAALLWTAAWLRVIQLCQLPRQSVPESWKPAIAAHADRLRVIETDLISGPVTVGWRRPVILIPQHCVETLEPEHVRVLLEHESAHIARGDFFWNVLQTLVELLLFFHPAVWLLSRWIRAEREFACDDMVLSLGVRPALYARALARLAEHDRWLQTSSMAAQSPPLRARIERIFKNETSRRIGHWPYALGSLVLLVALSYALPDGVVTQANENESFSGTLAPLTEAQSFATYCCPK